LGEPAQDRRNREAGETPELHPAATEVRDQPACHRHRNGCRQNVEGDGPRHLVLGGGQRPLQLRQNCNHREGCGVESCRRNHDRDQHENAPVYGQLQRWWVQACRHTSARAKCLRSTARTTSGLVQNYPVVRSSDQRIASEGRVSRKRRGREAHAPRTCDACQAGGQQRRQAFYSSGWTAGWEGITSNHYFVYGPPAAAPHPGVSQRQGLTAVRARFHLFQPDGDAVGAAFGVDDGELEEAAAGGGELGFAAHRVGGDRHAVDEPGQRQRPAPGLDDDAGAVAGVLDVELGAVGREGDLQRGLQVGAVDGRRTICKQASASAIRGRPTAATVW